MKVRLDSQFGSIFVSTKLTKGVFKSVIKKKKKKFDQLERRQIFKFVKKPSIFELPHTSNVLLISIQPLCPVISFHDN